MLLPLCCLTIFASGVLSASTPATPTINPNHNLINDLNEHGAFSKILDLIGNSLHGMMTDLASMHDITLFLPTDDAMSRIPADVINDLKNDTQKLRQLVLYHTVENNTLRVRRNSNDKVLTSVAGPPVRINLYRSPENIHTAEGVKIVEENVRVANGIVHGIDGLMTPPEGDIVFIISHRPDMKILTALLGTAGLVDLIRADKNMTVFAPTDAAFAKLNANVTDFLGNHVPMLKDTLLYHVIDKTTMYSIGMRNAMTFHTADQGHDNLMLLEDYSGNIYLNRAKVTERDISATNGVIHVIDDVLIPTKVLVDMEGASVTVLG